jgi:NAD-dependent deacetylase
MTNIDQNIIKAAKMIIEANKIVALTGAGISVESGIPDFRGPSGLWKKYNPEIASISFFQKNPEEFWKFSLEIWKVLKRAKPNPAHKALAELEKMGKLRCVITQNIDGLHQKAGSKKVLEIHGSANWLICTSCRARHPSEMVVKQLKSGMTIPLCDLCGGLLRPDAVLFGDMLPQDVFNEAVNEVSKSDLMLIVGSSLVVFPAAQLPSIAKKNGAKIILINLEKTWFDDKAEIVIHGKAGDILPKVVKNVKKLVKAK